jgi:NAD(P)-dependent dehydrogenase (short-subunit alcohol dehydrogenase family)
MPVFITNDEFNNEKVEGFSMKGRTCLITGANSGIGKVMALEIAKKGANVVMVCRSKELGQAAQKEIVAQSNNQSVELLLADLSSMKQVRDLAEEFEQKHDKLHILINNAALWPTKRIMTSDGLETQFAINHLSHFLLTNLLLDIIKSSAPARIINTSSGLHKRAKIDFDNLQAEKSYRHMRVYGQTKLENVLFTKELARRLGGTDVTVNSFTPGVAKSPEKGASTGVYLATSPEVEGVTGKYFGGSKELRPNKIADDVEIAKRLWKISEELSGLREG